MKNESTKIHDIRILIAHRNMDKSILNDGLIACLVVIFTALFINSLVKEQMNSDGIYNQPPMLSKAID